MSASYLQVYPCKAISRMSLVFLEPHPQQILVQWSQCNHGYVKQID